MKQTYYLTVGRSEVLYTFHQTVMKVPACSFIFEGCREQVSDYSSCWQNAVPCGCRTEALAFLLPAESHSHLLEDTTFFASRSASSGFQAGRVPLMIRIFSHSSSISFLDLFLLLFSAFKNLCDQIGNLISRTLSLIISAKYFSMQNNPFFRFWGLDHAHLCVCGGVCVWDRGRWSIFCLSQDLLSDSYCFSLSKSPTIEKYRLRLYFV